MVMKSKSVGNDLLRTKSVFLTFVGEGGGVGEGVLVGEGVGVG